MIHLAKTINMLTDVTVIVIDESTGESSVSLLPKYTDLSMNPDVNKQLKEKYQNIVQLAPGQYVGYHITDNFIGIGKVMDRNSNFSLVVGFCKLADLNRVTAKEMLDNEKFTLSTPVPNSADKLYSYLERLPRVTPAYFLWLLSNINAAVNHEIVEPASLLSDNPFIYNLDKQVDNIFIKKREFADQYDDIGDAIKVEKQLISYVCEGNVAAVRKYWHTTAVKTRDTIAVSFVDSLRQTINNFIMVVSLVSRAVIGEGVSENLSLALASSYIARAEGCMSIAEFENLFPSMLEDYTKKVKEAKESNSDGNYIVGRALAYINDHITEKIAVSEVAKSLRISSGYLSSLFNKSTGMSITDYINKQKVMASKNLLDNTKLPLCEISAYFSFSSQSYYQNLFKKFTGMTPTDYRKKKSKKGGAG